MGRTNFGVQRQCWTDQKELVTLHKSVKFFKEATINSRGKRNKTGDVIIRTLLGSALSSVYKVVIT